MIRIILISLAMATAALGLGEDYIDAAPPTVYEATEPSPQNMDFDKDNNQFVAHSGWYNGLLVHYYKFRMYTPSTYKDVIKMGSTNADVPIQKVYIVTTTGDLTGAVGKPIIEYHTDDGNVYSDFMEIEYVTAPDDYTADMYKSKGDIESSGATTTASGIILNLPVVPTGSTLQDPAAESNTAAPKDAGSIPISPVMVWYKGVEVTTYVFEVTDQAAADYFASTRDDPADPAFKIYVIPFATSTSVNAIPIWHINQYSRGVTAGENGGGPNPAGMRNIINLDRPDAGYSPNWQVWWGTEMPINYEADEARNSNDLTAPNGFAFPITPMFVNCPNVGNTVAVDTPSDISYQTSIKAGEDSWILGSDMSLIMQKDIPIAFQTKDGIEIATTTTNMMGAYEFELMSSQIPEGTTEIVVVAKDMTIRTIEVDQTSSQQPTEPPTTSSPTTSSGIVKGVSLGCFVLSCLATLIM